MKTFELINFGSNFLKHNNIETNTIDSEIILSHVMGITRENILVSDKEIDQVEIAKFKSLLLRRSKNEPIAYITKKKEFRSTDFYIDKNSLIPRPETELLIDPIVKYFKRKSLFFLDIGVGSGCIMLSILKELKHAKAIGTDISKKTIINAKINLRKLKIHNRAKILCKSFEKINNYEFDLVVSNPPYVAKRDINRLKRDVKSYEPILALNGGNDGLDVIKKVIYKSRSILKINGILALEIGRGQYLSVLSILKKYKFKQIKIIKDYKDNVRCIFSTLL
tara:strand:- start:176 stop:1012 length:837 start_codon:yes stop_codon:yes gene_type:complete